MDKVVERNFWNKKKVFITGSAGFKGSWLSVMLLKLGAEVEGYSLMPENISNFYNILNKCSINRYMRTIEGDVRNLGFLKKSIAEYSPDIVIHMAAQPIVRESYKNPVYTYETNVMGTVNILESLRFADSVKSFVNVTTDKVYENKEKKDGYEEKENLCGFDPYSNSKSCSELVTYSYKNSFFTDRHLTAISTARSGNVIGGGDFATDRIIPDCYRATKVQEDIIIRNPFSIRPYQHVLDCLSGYLCLARLQFENKESYEGSYNFGPNDKDCINTEKLVSLFCEKWNGRDTGSVQYIIKNDGGPHEANFLKLNCEKAVEKLEWRPSWNIDKAMEKSVEWYCAYNSGENMLTVTEKQIEAFML